VHLGRLVAGQCVWWRWEGAANGALRRDDRPTNGSAPGAGPAASQEIRNMMAAPVTRALKPALHSATRLME